MTNTITILALIAILGISVPSAFACLENDVIHWTNLPVILTNALEHSTEPDISPGRHFWLPIPTTNGEVISTESMIQLAADRLNDIGYTNNGQPVTSLDVEQIDYLRASVGYSTICKNGIQQMIGGMLLQPDTMTLALAYGIANSIWMVPLAIGAGAGIYLTKNKLKR